MTMLSICLAIVFNHRFDQNIEKLEYIYRNRFSCVRYLIPFYDGDRDDVIPVYESSYQFQGYIIQAYKELIKTGCEYYMFIADDLILNPTYDEKRINELFLKSGNKIIIPPVRAVNCKGGFGWYHARFSPRAFLQRGTQWKDTLPDYYEMKDRFEQFLDERFEQEYTEDFFSGKLPGETESDHQKEIDRFLILNKGRRVLYPVVASYADFFCIHKDELYKVANICGVFSAMNLFVEIALPTAIAMTMDRKDVLLLSDTDLTMKLYWGAEDIENFAKENKYDYNTLINNWDPKTICIHPVKLSKWEVQGVGA